MVIPMGLKYCGEKVDFLLQSILTSMHEHIGITIVKCSVGVELCRCASI